MPRISARTNHMTSPIQKSHPLAQKAPSKASVMVQATSPQPGTMFRGNIEGQGTMPEITEAPVAPPSNSGSPLEVAAYNFQMANKQLDKILAERKSYINKRTLICAAIGLVPAIAISAGFPGAIASLPLTVALFCGMGALIGFCVATRSFNKARGAEEAQARQQYNEAREQFRLAQEASQAPDEGRVDETSNVGEGQ